MHNISVLLLHHLDTTTELLYWRQHVAFYTNTSRGGKLFLYRVDVKNTCLAHFLKYLFLNDKQT